MIRSDVTVRVPLFAETRNRGQVLLAAGAVLCALVFTLAGTTARAQSAPAPRLGETEAIWRAASRLGYWPSPELARAMREHPRGAEGWALDEVDRAFEASRQPARIPQQMTSLGQPLPVVFDEFRKDREARRKVAEPAQKGDGQAPMRADGQPPFLRTVTQEAVAWRLASCSDPSLENPLLARMTEFWFNHLNVFAGKGAVRPFVGDYVLNAIRPNVLGRFETLLLASARHPAMLFYLDQAQNVADGSPGKGGSAGNTRGINENYARELMELHTLGVDGGYAQRDVRELARVLTGWTVDPQAGNGFRFAERLHDQGEKTVLGRRFAADGEREGLRAIAMLAEQPATARRIARRLAQFYVTDEPSPALVDRLATEFSASRGDLRRVMRALVRSPEFWDPASELFKTPYDFACSALGASTQVKATGDGARPRMVLVAGFLAGAGQPVHGWQTPDGYKTDAATWLSPEALTRRVDLATALNAGADDPVYLMSFFSPATRERLMKLPVTSRAGLAAASPDFMRK
jgi:uncharacterized protein (DUF1800 family)